MGLEWLTGKACNRVHREHPGKFAFEFGDGSFTVNCLWRLVEGGSLRLTSGDDGHKYGLPAPIDARAEVEARLRDRRVAGSRFREGTADLVLEFEGGIELELIADSAGYEPWHFGAPGVHLIAIGGGGLADFSPVDPAETGTE